MSAGERPYDNSGAGIYTNPFKINFQVQPMAKKLFFILAFGLCPAMSAWAEGDCHAGLAAVDARLASSQLGPTGAALKQMRDQAASMCNQGQDAMANQLLAMLSMSLPPSESEVAAANTADEDSKALLTNDFLAGEWCSMTGEERSQLVFNVDGTPCDLGLLYGLPARASIAQARRLGLHARVYIPYGEAYRPYALFQVRGKPWILWWLAKDLLLSLRTGRSLSPGR